LHLLNLPAGSDVNRLLVQIAALEREVRELRKRLEDTHDEIQEPYT
jgi:phage host-nuclease inhibitor protein Gam